MIGWLKTWMRLRTRHQQECIMYTQPLIARDLPVQQWTSRWPELRIDQFTNFEMMKLEQLDLLHAMIKYAWDKYSLKHNINSDYREGDKGQHGKGNADDIVLYREKLGDTDCITQFLIASRFDFGGIGVYPYWNSPGLHVDCREDRNPRAGWWRDQDGTYYSLDTLYSTLKERGKL